MRSDRHNLLVLLVPAIWATLGPATSVVRGQVRAQVQGQTPPASAPASRAAAPKAPLTFARSGAKAVVTIAPVNLPSMRMCLRAFGRTWAEATAKWAGKGERFDIEFDVPSVRVPTVFSVTHAELREPELAQLVAYPDRDVEWDKKITLYSAGAPAWFAQWASAAGLPVKQIAAADVAEFKPAPAEPNGGALLILGPGAAGKDLAEVTKLAREKAVNVLVLDADWFAGAAGPASAAPAQMHEGLAEIAKQTWPQPLKFATRRQPWGGIANRWAWIADANGLPLVEAVCAVFSPRGTWTFNRHDLPEPSHPVVLSYLSWQEQLGRREHADETMLALLRASAQERKWVLPGVEPTTCVGDAEPWDANQRPVLRTFASHFDPGGDSNRFLMIVDLRGPRKLLEGFAGNVMEVGHKIDRAKGTALLILGDDKMLDEWEWLKLDRAKKTIHRPEVVWLSDDELPPSKDSQVRLMLKLTELGVPLAPPGQEEKRE